MASESMSSAKAEQIQALADHRDAVKLQAALMRKSIDAGPGELKTALKHAALLLSELRTNALSPKTYYDLFLETTEALAPLQTYFMRLLSSGAVRGQELYDAVQHSGNVLPRLYLLVAAGSANVRAGQMTPKFVLEDLLQMVKGVQHPQRGLFLRYYCITALKDLLPEGSPAAVADSVTFVTDFLVEMNRLWTRMGTSAASGPGGKNKKRRERERQELRLLVGSNLTRLAKLEGMSFGQYSSMVLPRLLAEVTDCKDKVAQSYLLDVLLQVFPVEWHLATLTQLLDCTRTLVPDHSSVKSVFRALLGRIQDGLTVARGDSPAAADSAASNGLPAPGPANPAVPSSRVEGLPRDIDVFGSILAAVTSLAEDPLGPFRGSATSPARAAAASAAASAGPSQGGETAGVDGAATASAAGQEASAAAGGDSEQPTLAADASGDAGASSSTAAAGAGGPPSLSTTPVKSSADPAAIAARNAVRSAALGGTGSPSSPSVNPRLAAMREVTAALSAQDALASLLEVYVALQSFAVTLYPGHTPYVDAVLEHAGRVLHDVLNLGPAPSVLARTSGTGNPILTTPELASATSSLLDAAGNNLQASMLATDAAEALLHLLEGAQPLTPLTALDFVRGTGGVIRSAGFGAGGRIAPGVLLDDVPAMIAVDLLGGAQDALGVGVLHLSHYADVLDAVPHKHQREVASRLLNAVLGNPATPLASSSSSAAAAGAVSPRPTGPSRITDPDDARRLLAGLQPLIRDGDGSVVSRAGGNNAAASSARNLSSALSSSSLLAGAGQGGPSYSPLAGGSGSTPQSPAFVSEQSAMARLVHLLGRIGPVEDGGVSPQDVPVGDIVTIVERDLDVHSVALEALSWGGAQRVAYTFPQLARGAMRLLQALGRAPNGGPAELVKRLFAQLHAACSGLAVTGHTQAGLDLFLEVATNGVACEAHAHIAQEALAQAFLLFEALHSSDVTAGARALKHIVTALAKVIYISEQDYYSLAQRAAALAGQMLRKSDATRLLLAGAGLFWRDGLIAGSGASAAAGGSGKSKKGAAGASAGRFERPADVLSCLQRAVRMADVVMPPNANLFIDCLNATAAFQAPGVTGVTQDMVKDLVTVCKAHVEHWPAHTGTGRGGRALGSAPVRRVHPSPLLTALASSSCIGAPDGDSVGAVDAREYLGRTLAALGLGPAWTAPEAASSANGTNGAARQASSRRGSAASSGSSKAAKAADAGLFVSTGVDSSAAEASAAVSASEPLALSVAGEGSAVAAASAPESAGAVDI